MAGEESNGSLRRELDGIARALEKMEARNEERNKLADERFNRLSERVQETRDAQGEQRGKLAMLIVLASAIVSTVVQLALK